MPSWGAETSKGVAQAASARRRSGEDAIDPFVVIEPDRLSLHAQPPPEILELLASLPMLPAELGRLDRVGVGINLFGQQPAANKPLLQVAPGASQGRRPLLT
ncbi:MAG: hypothetical protein JWL70_2917 [Acidimicrobiia bacterium]|nr:hypothetical protein [Acidimicrobiia bacterium]